MCVNVSDQISDKTKFISEKVDFLEKCESELQTVLDGFDEQIQKLLQIEKST